MYATFAVTGCAGMLGGKNSSIDSWSQLLAALLAFLEKSERSLDTTTAITGVWDFGAVFRLVSVSLWLSDGRFVSDTTSSRLASAGITAPTGICRAA